jgi:hypothetical protein
LFLTDSKDSDRPLPIGKLSVETQILVLRSYVAFYEQEKRAASYKDIAAVSAINETNVSSCKGFWESIGLLIQEDGKSRPSIAAIEFSKRYSSNTDEAWAVFRSAIKDSWFIRQLAMSMQLKPVQTEDEIVDQLAQATGVAKSDKKAEDSLKKLVELMKTCGSLQKKEGQNALTFSSDSPAIPPLRVSDADETITVILANERYSIDSSLMKAFVKEHGKRTSDTDYKLD